MLLILLAAAKFYYISVTFPYKFDGTIKKYAAEYNLSPTLIACVINAESGYNKYASSNAGALGLMQLMPATAKFMCEQNGIDYNLSRIYEVDYNINLGCAYFRYLQNKFGDETTMLCAYNAGETKVRDWLKNPIYSFDGKTLSIIPYEETDNYIIKIKISQRFYQPYYIN